VVTILPSRMESFMNTSTSASQEGHLTRSTREGTIAISCSQAVHLKCIMEPMKALLVILLVAVSVHAQSLADAARKERGRRANLKPAEVIKAEGVPSPAGAKAGEGKKPEEPPKPPIDPVKEYNDQLQKLRARVQALQDEEAATQLQISDLTN